ncbi:hypothetical protein [Helicobacter labacensis]|nr:hypothetical protein [Helicobacter labacensis]
MQHIEQITKLQDTEGSYPLSPEALAEFLAYGVPLQEEVESTQHAY